MNETSTGAKAIGTERHTCDWQPHYNQLCTLISYIARGCRFEPTPDYFLYICYGPMPRGLRRVCSWTT